MKKYYYSIYGLKVVSDIKIVQLIPYEASDNYDVEIVINKGTSNFICENNINDEYMFSKTISWFVIPEVGFYKMKDGNRIEIDPLTNDIKKIICFLLGSALGILLIQRNTVAIHGASVKVNNKAIILTGESGAGKSTLTAGFRSRGYNYLADDISALDINNDVVLTNSAYPQQKICDDAVIELGIDTTNLIMLDEDRRKYAVPTLDNFCSNSTEVNAIIEVVPKDNIDKVSIEEIVGINKINYVLKNIYRVGCARDIGIEGEYFNNIIKISSLVKFFVLERPRNKFTINEQIDSIIELVNKR